MRKILFINLFVLSVLGLAIPPSSAFAEDATTAQRVHYSVANTPAGKLIDDPATAAILKRLIPTVWANDMFHSMGRDLTLKGIQQYEPVLTEEKLAEIQAEFDKLPLEG